MLYSIHYSVQAISKLNFTFLCLGNSGSSTEASTNGSINIGGIISGGMTGIVVVIVVLLVAIGALLFCNRRKQRANDEVVYENKAKSEALENPTYVGSMEWPGTKEWPGAKEDLSVANAYTESEEEWPVSSEGYSTLNMHYSHHQRIARESDYVTIK